MHPHEKQNTHHRPAYPASRPLPGGPYNHHPAPDPPGTGSGRNHWPIPYHPVASAPSRGVPHTRPPRRQPVTSSRVAQKRHRRMDPQPTSSMNQNTPRHHPGQSPTRAEPPGSHKGNQNATQPKPVFDQRPPCPVRPVGCLSNRRSP